MSNEQIISLFDIVSFIVGIASIVISITSLILSILFYQWSKKENEATASNVIKIEEKITFLDKLFDQLYAKAFDAVRSHGEEMQRMLRESIGSFGVATQKNYDLELYLMLSKSGTYTISQIAHEIGLDEQQTNKLLQGISKDARYKNLSIEIKEDNIITSVKSTDQGADQSN